MKKTYKVKIQDKRGYLRFKEVTLTIQQYNDMLKMLDKENPNGYILKDLWEI